MYQALLWKGFRDLSSEKGQRDTNLSTKKSLAEFPSPEARKYQAFSSTSRSFSSTWKQYTSTSSGDFKLSVPSYGLPTQDARLGLQADSGSRGQKQARETSAQLSEAVDSLGQHAGKFEVKRLWIHVHILHIKIYERCTWSPNAKFHTKT